MQVKNSGDAQGGSGRTAAEQDDWLVGTSASGGSGKTRTRNRGKK